jgi:hypothetical protein
VVLLVIAASVQIAGAQVVETSDKEDTTGMPRVVFYRPSHGPGHLNQVAIYCDLTKLARLRDNTYFEVALSPGVHVCSTQVLESRWAPDVAENVEKPEELSLDVTRAPRQWVSVHFKNVGWFHNTFTLTPEDAERGNKEMEKKHTHPVKPEEQFIRSITRTPAGAVH